MGGKKKPKAGEAKQLWILWTLGKRKIMETIISWELARISGVSHKSHIGLENQVNVA